MADHLWREKGRHQLLWNEVKILEINMIREKERKHDSKVSTAAATATVEKRRFGECSQA